MNNFIKFLPAYLCLFFLLTFAPMPNGVRAHSQDKCAGLSSFYQPLGELVLTHTSDDLENRLCQKISRSQKRLSKGKIARAIKKLRRVIKITQKHVPDEINQVNADLIIAEAGRLAGILENNMGLPPDPGEAGKTTLEGIDSDGDDVRDDIQRYIALTHPDSAKVRALFTMSAKHLQKVLIDAGDKQLSIQHGHEGSSIVTQCEEFIEWDLKIDLTRDSLALIPEILNTDQRSRAYIQYNHQLSGNNFSIGRARSDKSPLKAKCDFNPDELPN